jgi:hypothetical protein
MTNIELDRYRGQLQVRQNRNTCVSLAPVLIQTPTLGVVTPTFDQQFMEEVTAALDRIKKGTFGDCEECGTTIPAGRLEVLPYARFCVDCVWRLQRGATDRR